MSTTVLKFGGTSVATPEAIERLASIVSGVAGDRVIVVSATAGTTNALIAAANAAGAGDAEGAEAAVERLQREHDLLYQKVVRAKVDVVCAGLQELAERTKALLRSVGLLRECSRRSRDAILAYGELASSEIVAAALRARGVEAEPVAATGIVVTDDAFGNAAPVFDETYARATSVLGPMLRAGQVPVVTGFIGATRDGVTTTLGRGASDYTAAILAAALRADECLIYTDVSGVMSADPRIVPSAKPLPQLSYAEAAELSYFGAKVLHPRAVLPAVELGIPVRILNTFAASDAGTTIVGEAVPDGSVVKATTSLGGLALLTVQGAGMSGIPGFAAKVFDTTAAQDVSVLMISQASSENSICIVVPADTVDRLKDALERMLAKELAHHDVERVAVERPIAVVAAVGDGMRGTPGVAARVFGALGRLRINVVAIAQGSSELNISFCVAEADQARAVRAIHDEFHSSSATRPSASGTLVS
ncbi:MAG: aspartate kinase [Chloroflexota bacterium]|nr:aspartate kinase [Chloroflexota bacterium]MDE3103259.1 aspartate kinase [Chloroflexota bacterium]